VLADIEDDFAGELRSLRPPGRVSTIGPALARAFSIGIKAGVVPSAIVFVIYFARNYYEPLPWVTVASLLAVYGPVVGILLATSVQMALIATDRIARVGYGLWLIANPITGGAFAGLVAGIAPGAVGVMVFGSYAGPFVGTGLIAFGMIGGCVMVAAPLALEARRARCGRKSSNDVRVIAAATIVATLILCAVAAVVAPVIVGSAFAEARGAMENHTGLVGAVAGALGGCVVGTFIGITIALGRWLGYTPRRGQGKAGEPARRVDD
jgi:hypothetical protein